MKLNITVIQVDFLHELNLKFIFRFIEGGSALHLKVIRITTTSRVSAFT